jgi:hypothetical protein
VKYTVQGGVETPLSERISDNFKFILPLLLLLVLAIYIGITHNFGGRRGHSPLTLGIYTVKTNGGGGNGTSSNKADANHGNGNLTAGPSNLQSASTGLAPATTIPSTGGSGGLISTSSLPTGGGTGGSSAGGGTTTPPITTYPTPPPPPVPTFPCVDLVTGQVMTCTYAACTPPIALLLGQKALLTTSGTCAVIN